jgi:tetratricopeptide (TPR) repeat protein
MDQHTDKDEALVQELNGLCEMGMHEAVLEMVDRLLSRKLSSRQFNEAIRALLVHAVSLNDWSDRIEKAYTRLSLRNSRMCRSVMLCYYHSIRNYQKALEFLPARSSGAPLELAFALDTFLALRLVKKADALVARCLRLQRRTVPDGELRVLIHSLGDYFASKRDWESAVILWQEVISDDLLGPQAYVEIAIARAAQARQAVNEGLSRIKSLRNAPDDLAIPLPGNLKARLDEAEMELRFIDAALDQCLPPET